MPKWTEKIQKLTGTEGEYHWIVAVWRVDTDAVCNLRVKTVIYRRSSWLFGLFGERDNVYSETEYSSFASVSEDIAEAVDDAKRRCETFDDERAAIEGVQHA